MKIKNFSDYNRIDESDFKSVIMAGLMSLLSSVNLSAQVMDKISKSALSDISSPKDLKNLERISTLCDSLNKEEISWSDIPQDSKIFFDLISQPLINIDTKKIKKGGILRLSGDMCLDLNIDTTDRTIILELKMEAENILNNSTESFVFDRVSININEESKIITPHMDLLTDFKINKLESSGDIEFNITPTHFKPNFRVIRLVDDFIKASYNLDNVRIFTTLGVWNKNLIPGSRAIGFQFPFHR